MMNENLMGLFSNETQTATAGNRSLAKTGQLTDLSSVIASAVMKSAQSNMEANGSLIAASQTSADALDKLITTMYDLNAVDVEFLKTEDLDTLDKMLKSQQSKKSRSKSNTMTLDNYMSMMNAAIAEQLLRLAMNKPKGSITHTSSDNSGYTEEEYQALAADQETLGKAIRNVQSKKSIAKSKANFNPESEQWQALLVTEARLKSLRVGGGHSTETVNKANMIDQIDLLLANIDLETIKSSDAKTMLAKISEIIKG